MWAAPLSGAASGAASGAGDAKTCACAWSDAGATYVHVPGSRPAPSCTILLRDLRDLISFDASSRSFQARLRVASLSWTASCDGPGAWNCHEFPTFAYFILLGCAFQSVSGL